MKLSNRCVTLSFSINPKELSKLTFSMLEADTQVPVVFRTPSHPSRKRSISGSSVDSDFDVPHSPGKRARKRSVSGSEAEMESDIEVLHAGSRSSSKKKRTGSNSSVESNSAIKCDKVVSKKVKNIKELTELNNSNTETEKKAKKRKGDNPEKGGKKKKKDKGSDSLIEDEVNIKVF